MEMIEVEDDFAYHGSAHNYGVNSTGSMCEDILCIFGTKT